MHGCLLFKKAIKFSIQNIIYASNFSFLSFFSGKLRF